MLTSPDGAKPGVAGSMADQDDLSPYLYDTRHLMTMSELREARPAIFLEPDSRERASAASMGWLFQGVPEAGLMFNLLTGFDDSRLPDGPVAMFVVVDDLGRRTPPRFAALWTKELGWVLPNMLHRR